ncbi:serine O-acetyltransferase [Parahaliea aestuarii]|uniref:Serine acetyltransferase n=1 Tax=Parahaliea aestuarii TaxID=1852021 RepID=A0A5C8ZRM8_9GAMM|nr:serine acetyltransferase [Parahaliea aestuarii]TXS90464.1 serine acetyltransferase [Parahaliea aestuarii]
MTYQRPTRYFNAVSLYRCYRGDPGTGFTPLRKFAEALNYFLFNCSIPAACVIGDRTYCSHRGMSVVIHPQSVIGDDCVIGTCVTLGGRGKGMEGAPRIGNNVYIATGAKILGPVSIGDNAVIGANSVVLHDVAANQTVVGIPATPLPAQPRDSSEMAA